PFLRLALSMLFKSLDRPGGEVDGSPAPRCFRLDKNKADAGFSLKSATDSELSHLEVDVLPLEAKRLAQPQAGGSQDHPQGVEPVVLGCLEQAPRLLDA